MDTLSEDGMTYSPENYARLKELCMGTLMESLVLIQNDDRDLARDLKGMLGITLPSAYGMVVLLDILPRSVRTEKEMQRPVCQEVISRHLVGDAMGIFFGAGKRLGLYICPGESDSVKARYKAFREQAEDAAEELETMGISVVISASAIKKNSAPRQLYRDALVAHDHLAEKGERVRMWEDLPAPVPRDRLKAGTAERKFMASVINRSFYEAVSALDEIIDSMLAESQPPLEHVRSHVFQRLETVLSICGEELHPDLQSHEVGAALTSVSQAASFADLKTSIYDFFATAADSFKGTQAEDKFALVTAFVKKNYMDVNLGAAMICDNFKFSPSYLSKLVRKSAGCGVVELIHDIRIQKARELLSNLDIPVKDIVEMVGFDNRWTFIRAFKKLEGCSPSEYRAKIKTG